MRNYKLFGLEMPSIQKSPNIILTKEEAIEKGFKIPNKISIVDWLFNNRMKCLGYCEIDNKTIFISLKGDKDGRTK